MSDWWMLACLVVPVVAALMVGSDRRLKELLAVHIVFASVLGSAVWAGAFDFTRVLLPVVPISLLAIAGSSAFRRPDFSEAVG